MLPVIAYVTTFKLIDYFQPDSTDAQVSPKY